MKKRILTFALALCMLMALAMPASAADTDDLPDLHDPRVKSHTIEITLEPGEVPTDDGIMPLMWGQQKPQLGPRSSQETPEFNIPDRYFAFELSATGTNGQAVSGTIAAELLRGGGVKAAASGDADGNITKYDWIQVNTGTYKFKLYNYTYSTLNFTLTYYSWP